MIEKIRNQRWLLIGIVGISLIGFLVNGAVLEWLRGGSADIGEIDGDVISAEEWMSAVDKDRKSVV